MASFEIPDGPTTVPLNTTGEGEQMVRGGNAVYGVTNKSAVPLGGRLSVQVAGDAKAEWFTIDGEKERVFAAGENQTVTVAIRIPAAVSPGDYKFRLRVVSVNDPDNDHMDSPVGTVAVPPPEGAAPTPKPFPAWIIAVIAGVVILIIGIGIAVWWFTRDAGGGEAAGRMPDLEGVAFAEASQTLLALDDTLVITRAADEDSDRDYGLVTETEPDAGRSLDLGQEVVLTVATGPSIPAPRLEQMSLTEAKIIADGLDLDLKPSPARLASGLPLGHVISQSPAPGAPTHRGSEIVLATDPGIQVPNVLTWRRAEARDRIRDANLGARSEDTCWGATASNAGTVSTQTPAAGTFVSPGDAVTISIFTRLPAGQACLRAIDLSMRERTRAIFAAPKFRASDAYRGGGS